MKSCGKGQSGQFERIENADWGCRTLQAGGHGAAIFGLCDRPAGGLAVSLSANWRVKLHGALEMAVTTIAAIGILATSGAVAAAAHGLPPGARRGTLVLVVLIDVTFIGGYRPFDGGDDGLMFSGFARDMLQHLVAGDITGALKGFEPVFYFNPGMRYFRALEYLIFGDSYLAYLLSC